MASMSYSSRSLARAIVAPIAIEPCGYIRATSLCSGLPGRSIQSRMTSNRSTALSWLVLVNWRRIAMSAMRTSMTSGSADLGRFLGSNFTGFPLSFL